MSEFMGVLKGNYEAKVSTKFIKCYDLCDLVPFLQLKKRGKQSWRSVSFSTTLPWMLFIFLHSL